MPPGDIESSPLKSEETDPKEEKEQKLIPRDPRGFSFSLLFQFFPFSFFFFSSASPRFSLFPSGFAVSALGNPIFPIFCHLFADFYFTHDAVHDIMFG